jgi:hypothetical protein
MLTCWLRRSRRLRGSPWLQRNRRDQGRGNALTAAAMPCGVVNLFLNHNATSRELVRCGEVFGLAESPLSTQRYRPTSPIAGFVASFEMRSVGLEPGPVLAPESSLNAT